MLPTGNSACCRDRTGLDGLDDDINYNEITERAENDLTPSWHTVVRPPSASGVISSRPCIDNIICVFFFSFCPQVVQSHFIVFGMTIFQACWSAIKTYGYFLRHYSFISFAHPFIKKNGCDDQLQRPTLWFLHSGFQGFNGKITTFKSYSVCDVANGKLLTQLDGHELCLPIGRPRCCHASEIQPSTPSFLHFGPFSKKITFRSLADLFLHLDPECRRHDPRCDRNTSRRHGNTSRRQESWRRGAAQVTHALPTLLLCCRF